MQEIRNPREIVRRRELTAALASMSEKTNPDQPEFKAKALALLKQALADGRAVIQERFEAARSNDSGLVCAREHCFLIDQLIKVIHDLATDRVFRLANRTAGERLAIVAVGGYGRGELAPQSDVDLLFLFPYKQPPWGEQVVEFMLYLLWDLGLKVGHATRSLDDCIRLAKQDLTIRTALLESRLVWGDEALAHTLRLRFLKEVAGSTGPDFIEAKLNERDARHQRMGDSRYVVEPNIKDGKGGLRDLHTLFWIAKYLYQSNSVAELVSEGVFTVEENRRFQAALAFLWSVRCHLHYLTGRPEERLTFDVQRELAKRMRYTDHAGTRGVERFMKHYFLIAKDVGDLTRIFCSALEQRAKRKPRFGFARLGLRKREIDGFAFDGNRLDVANEKVFAEKPIEMLRLFHVAQKRDVDIHPNALRLIQQNLRLINAKLRADPEANRLFLEMLTSENDPETTLRRLNEAGVFGRFVPDFGRVVAQMQHDMYHVYTVDEHTIRAIGLLSQIEKGKLADDHPLSHKVIHQIHSRRVLYMAVLLHDIAKGRGGDHSILGEDVANKLCPRVGLTAQETETVAWLVRWHLAMSATAFKRDISDPKTVADFVAHVQSPERLKLLLILTVADIRAVGPGVWNGWKGQLLRELYFQAESAMSGGHATEGREGRVQHAKKTLEEALPDWSQKERERYLARHSASYWLAFDADRHARHARMIRQAERAKQSLTVETRSDRFRAITEVAVFTSDHPGLFARIAGAMALTGANILEAKIFTTTDGMALDTFFIQDAEGGAFDRPDRLARLSTSIERALSGEVVLREALDKARGSWPKRTDVFTVQPIVIFDNDASNTHTVIEVNGRDRPGLLHDVTYAMYRLSLSIASAQIATYGERAVDVFYVKDMFGLKVDQRHKLAAIEKRLLAALRPPEAKAGTDAERPAKPRVAARGRERVIAAE